MRSPRRAGAGQSSRVRIVLYTDLVISPAQLFWHRDLGLLTKAFRDLGHDAWLIVHPAKLHPPKSKVRSEAGPPPTTRRGKGTSLILSFSASGHGQNTTPFAVPPCRPPLG